MTNTQPSSRGWAIATLLLGSAVAFPFLRSQPESRANTSAEVPREPSIVPGASVTQPASGTSAMPQTRMVTGPLPATASNRGALSELAGGIFPPPEQAALPEWYQPASNLDTLIGSSIVSQASNGPEKSLDSLPTWTHQSRQSVAKPVASPLPTGLVQQRNSPWEGTAQRTAPKSPSERETPWPDQQLATRSWQTPETEVSGRKNVASPGNLVGSLMTRTDETSSASDRVEAPADRQPTFVYQPGFNPERP